MVASELLQELIYQAGSRKSIHSAYGGELTVQEAWNYLKQAPAQVVDVRTAPEWSFSGLPSLQQTRGTLACVSWVLYPDFEANPFFRDHMERQVPDRDAVLFFLCKTGGRSHAAANHAAASGYPHSFNLTHGFEGDQNADGQRGRVNGWKAEGLPWTQA